MTSPIPDGIYFVHPEGGGWVAGKFKHGRLISMTEERNAGTHAAANDSWAGVLPSDLDVELNPEDSAFCVGAMMGAHVKPDRCVVTRVS